MKKISKSIVATFATVAFTAMFALCGCKTDKIEATPADEIITTIETTITTEETTTTTSVTTSITTIEVTTTAEETTEETTIDSEEPTTESPVEQIASSVSTYVETEAPKPVEPEYVVYKSSTHYIHRSTCHWASSGELVRIENTEGIEVRRCTECNPDMEIVNEYVEVLPEPTYSVLSDYEKNCLAVMLCHECSPRAGASHNAHSVAAMVNRVNAGNSSSIYNAISSSCCPWWPYGHGSWCMDNGCYDGMDSTYAYEAIEYYLNNSSSYSWVTGWYASGDGVYNVYH